MILTVTTLALQHIKNIIHTYKTLTTMYRHIMLTERLNSWRSAGRHGKGSICNVLWDAYFLLSSNNYVHSLVPLPSSNLFCSIHSRCWLAWIQVLNFCLYSTNRQTFLIWTRATLKVGGHCHTIDHEWPRCTLRSLYDASHNHYHIIHFNHKTHTTEEPESLCHCGLPAWGPL